MLKRVHLISAVQGAATIALFFSSTILVELFGSHAAVARPKDLIVLPGLFVLVPAMAIARVHAGDLDEYAGETYPGAYARELRHRLAQ